MKKLWGETGSSSVTDLLHNLSMLKHVVWLPSDHYALAQNTLHVCYVYPTTVSTHRKRRLSVGSPTAGHWRKAPLLQGLPLNHLFRDTGVEYGSVQAVRRRESDGNMLRHVLSATVPMDLVPTDPDWGKVKALYSAVQVLVTTLRKALPGLQIYGLTEIAVPQNLDYVVAERGNVRALLTSLRQDTTVCLNIEIRVVFFALTTPARIVPFDAKVARDQH